jgi:hypothetical protein
VVVFGELGVATIVVVAVARICDFHRQLYLVAACFLLFRFAVAFDDPVLPVPLHVDVEPLVPLVIGNSRPGNNLLSWNPGQYYYKFVQAMISPDPRNPGGLSTGEKTESRSKRNLEFPKQQ